jgi:hypothetical protein
MFFPGSNITCFTFYTNLWPTYWLYLVYVRFQFPKGTEFSPFSFSRASGLALWPAQSPIQRLSTAFAPPVKWPGNKTDPLNFLLAQRLTVPGSCTHTWSIQARACNFAVRLDLVYREKLNFNFMCLYVENTGGSGRQRCSTINSCWGDQLLKV